MRNQFIFIEECNSHTGKAVYRISGTGNLSGVTDSTHSGRPQTATTPEIVGAVEQLSLIHI